MKPKRIINLILGLGLIAMGLYFIAQKHYSGFFPAGIGASLLYLGFKPGRASTLVFGHTCVILGCYLVTMGIYLLPNSQPQATFAYIMTMPLFWGLFSIFGGICAIYHAFCGCVLKNNPLK